MNEPIRPDYLHRLPATSTAAFLIGDAIPSTGHINLRKRADDDPWKECMPTIAIGASVAIVLVGIGIAIGAVIWA